MIPDVHEQKRWTLNELVNKTHLHMKEIVAIIEKGEDGGYAIYADGGLPLFANGMTEKEAREEFERLVPEQAEFIKENTGAYPDWFDGTADIKYRYDMSGFFRAFPFINATGLAKAVGINPSLMRRYKSGISKAGAGNKDIIQRKLDDIVERLRVVKF